VVGTVMSNLGLEVGLRASGIEFRRAAVGDRYVLAMLREAQGILGGHAGLTAAVLHNGTRISHVGRAVLHPGDRLLIRNAGGGGYGPPSERDPRALADDLENGYVTVDEMHRYGR
jgi:N-methylhydantoinase B/oxoprolinase/acetone carboxylase alpha subunit